MHKGQRMMTKCSRVCPIDIINFRNKEALCITREPDYDENQLEWIIDIEEINEERVRKIDDAIEKMIQDPDDITGIDDPLINKLDEEIIDTIKEEIRKELLGL